MSLRPIWRSVTGVAGSLERGLRIVGAGKFEWNRGESACGNAMLPA